MLSPEQRALLRKSANKPSQLFDAGMMTLVLDALDAAEQRIAELERIVYSVVSDAGGELVFDHVRSGQIDIITDGLGITVVCVDEGDAA